MVVKYGVPTALWPDSHTMKVGVAVAGSHWIGNVPWLTSSPRNVNAEPLVPSAGTRLPPIALLERIVTGSLNSILTPVTVAPVVLFRSQKPMFPSGFVSGTM